MFAFILIAGVSRKYRTIDELPEDRLRWLLLFRYDWGNLFN